ncbi:alpha-2-macroglobulin family protein [Deefgea rivuli]|uniref:alpha-2-macroglobulin family protein n=1 Tax=Deefgea rivuli TaxID=400948 RepID=UPI00048A2198|nr:MG2 domain-containing protein [Deefgea rivuli]
MSLQSLFTAIVLASSIPASFATTVSQFSPQNEVVKVQQVRATFSSPMIKFGDLSAAAPFDIACPVKGNPHWIDDKTWVMDFSGDFPAATTCTFSVKASLKAQNGEAISGKTKFSFNTGAPVITQSWPSNNSQITEDQFFVLQYNGNPPASSQLFCQVAGQAERLPVKRVSNDDKATLLKHLSLQKIAAQVDVVQCAQRLPASSQVMLINSRSASRDPQTINFTVEPEFTANFSCERQNTKSGCIPFQPFRLNFSRAIPRSTAEKIRLKTPDGEAKPFFSADDGDGSAEVESVRFKGPFTAEAEFEIKLPSALSDELKNGNAFPLKFKTADYPPLAKFAAAPFGILELNADPALPVTLRHIEADVPLKAAKIGGSAMVLKDDQAMMAWLAKIEDYHESTINVKGQDVQTRRLSLLKNEKSAVNLTLPGAPDAKGKWPFEVVGIPLKTPGLHIIELESKVLGKALLDSNKPMYVRTAALVTNLAVHFKHSKENAAVWVTTLDKGKPVADAKIAVYNCAAEMLWQGKTGSNGAALIPQVLTEKSCSGRRLSGFFVTARKVDAKGLEDVSFVRSTWNQGIESWRFPVQTIYSDQPALRAHTVFDRTLFRAGETVSMKHVIRVENSKGFALPKAGQLPVELTITHDGSGQEFKFPLTWRNGRYAESTFAIPANAKLGAYSLKLSKKGIRNTSGEDEDAGYDQDGVTLYTGTFRVEEFRLPVMRGQISMNDKMAVAPKDLALSIAMSYGNGGAAKALPVSVSAMLRERYGRPDGFDGFSFSAPETSNDVKTPSLDGKVVLNKSTTVLDANGAAKINIPNLPQLAKPTDLVAEATYTDPNGEVQTISRTLTLWPAAVQIGLQVEDWASVGKSVAMKAVVVDTKGKPVAGREVSVRAVRHTYLSSRKRLVGGFYAYESEEKTDDLGEVCSGKSDARGLVFCDVELKEEGRIELIAQTSDADKRKVSAAQSVWVSRQNEMWFDGENHDRIDVVPEKPTYQPGETAVFQVRMPFRKATAWVAIEREGVIETKVIELSGKNPTFELPIASSWAPNVYVSVLAVRGRVLDVPWYSFFTWGWKAPSAWWDAYWNEGGDFQAPTAMVDLSKPAFKYGLAQIKVGEAAHKLQVSVTADKAVYGIRKTAQVKVQVKLPDGKPAPAGTEVMFAAVDESLLELQPNTSWNLLDAMLQQRAYGVETATAQQEVIGKRHFGRKALPPGGGGGVAPTRELLDTLLVWQPKLILDANGSATIAVPLNDALTKFKLVAVAEVGAGQFGTGSTSIAVTQDLQISAGLPPLVREGDQFAAMATLRNGSSRAMKVIASAQATGLDLPPQTVDIGAGEAREIAWSVNVPMGISKLDWVLSAAEQGGEKAVDKLANSQQVESAIPVTVQQASLRRLDAPVTMPVALPPNAQAGRGGVNLQFQAKLTRDMPAVREWFLKYPYVCLEQKTSVAMGLQDKTRWDKIMQELPLYLDSDGLAMYYPPREGSGAKGYDSLTAYILSAAHEAGYAIPDASRDAMLKGLTLFVEGRIKRDFWSPRPDLDARYLAAFDAMARYGRLAPRQLAVLNIQPQTWTTAMLVDWLSLLQRVPTLPDRATRLAEAEQILRGRLTYQGTRMVFSTEKDDYWWWLMNNGDVNAARLILAVRDLPNWRDDVPKMLTGLLGRQQRGVWWTTNANVWGTLAVASFSKTFEAIPATGQAKAVLGDVSKSATWGTADPAPVMLPWPAKTSNLSITQQGTGAPWVTVQALAAVALKAPQVAGYSIKKTLTPLEPKVSGQYSRGDVVRVTLEIDAQADMTQVVVDDPIPAGATILGNGLGRDSAMATQGEKREGWAWPDFEERRFAGYRAYYSHVPRGKFSVEYTVRLNNAGTFQLPPSRVEAMYAPDVFGASPNAAMVVK